MERAEAGLRRSFRRRRRILVGANVALAGWLGVVQAIERMTAWLPEEQPARGQAMLLAFFGGAAIALVVQLAAWRCPACKKLLDRGAIFTGRCEACDTLFR